MPPIALFDDQGKRVRLGAELGRGGEAAVYSVEGEPELVAKIYHQPPGAAKTEKRSQKVHRRLSDEKCQPLQGHSPSLQPKKPDSRIPRESQLAILDSHSFEHRQSVRCSPRLWPCNRRRQPEQRSYLPRNGLCEPGRLR